VKVSTMRLANLFLAMSVFCQLAWAQSDAAAQPLKPKKLPDIPFEGQAPAPDFPESMEWLNTARPLSLKDLRGKIVLLDFWTYCCINCMHIIPDLKKLEAKYAKELVVIGVHSAKFENEKQTENIREAVKRYEIEHPVLNDRDFQVWRSYSARAWPTLMLINPQGRIIGAHSGEGIYELFDEIIGETVRYFDGKGLIDRKPVTFELEKQPPSILSYPGKIVADEKSKRLFFTDSNHNRVVVTSTNGDILESIGEGSIGLKDGTFETAQFFRPQGLCFDSKSELVYVADTENHAIRKVDLKARTVTTLAGNGRQARRHNQGGKGVELNSPWDLILIGEKLYIAMAGPHQLWTLDTKTLEAKVHAGTGQENIADGTLKYCALAQPSGITTDGKKLYFADSEVSAVRSADIDPDGRVETLIGEGLFVFGDVDGKFPGARLQHPLGVAFHEGMVFVADTYNHKIKKLNPKTKELTSFIGIGKRGVSDGPASKASLNEPAGLCFAGGNMYIADSNNHLIRVCDLKSGIVSTMQWKGMEKLVRNRPSLEKAPAPELPIQKVSSATRLLDLKLALPNGTKINPNASSKIKIKSDDAGIIAPSKPEYAVENETISIPIVSHLGKTKLQVELALYYCDKSNAGLCYFRDAAFTVPIEVSDAGEEKVTLNYTVTSR
jgi:thiol-disulfide isomerase/thioredoxin